MRVNYRYAGMTGTHNKSSTLSLFAVNPKHKLLHESQFVRRLKAWSQNLEGVCVCVRRGVVNYMYLHFDVA